MDGRSVPTVRPAADSGGFEATAPALVKRKRRSGRNGPANRLWVAALRKAADLERASTLACDVLDLLDEEANAYCGISNAATLGLENGLAAYNAAYLRHAALQLGSILQSAESRGLAGAFGTAGPILSAFGKRLHFASHQAAALFMNVARVRGELEGETPEARACHFSRLLLDRTYRSGCRERYPVLDRILCAMTEDAVASWAEFFQRLVDDWHLLDEVVPGGIGDLKELIFYAGDPHNGGRSVVIVHGGHGSIVYKPRSLDTDAVLGRALNWIDGHLRLGLEHVPTLRRDGYGWTAFIEQSDCADLREVRRCYERCGAMLGLLFVLGGADIHHENIICKGSRPYIVDAEALLTGPLAGPTILLRETQRARIESVLNTCYLPNLMALGDSYVDISGAGYGAGQELEFKRYILPEARDDLAAGPMQVSMPASANAPTLDGEPQAASDHVDCLEAGFRSALETIIRHRQEFLSRADLMPSFAAVRSRFIPRATAQYSRIAKNALHPHACADPSKHDEALSVLAQQSVWRASVASALLAADVAAIRRGDIPFFKGVANSRSIWTSAGEEIPRVFQESGYDSVVRRIRRLNEQVIELQIATMRLAFSARAFEPGKGASRSHPRASIGESQDLRLETAAAIGDRLIDQAIATRRHAHWVGRMVVGKKMSTVLIGPDLYGGTAGIGLFFGELARKTGEDRHRRTALTCLETIRNSAHMIGAAGIGAFDGASGCIYADLVISRALNLEPSPDLPSRLAAVANAVGSDGMYDVISGAAGALLVALRARQSSSTVELTGAADGVAHACARHLLDAAQHVGQSIAWKSSAFDVPLTGLAHGACGIALALAEYAIVYDSDEAWASALSALTFARASFDKKLGLWRDLRQDQGCMIAWCHGAAGMVLARQRIAELSPRRVGPEVCEDMEAGLEALVRHDGPRPDSICHGRSGNWEPLWRGEAGHRALAELEVAKLCDDWRNGILPGGDLSEPTPDLMNGLAGIGLQLLRSLDPKVPCVAILGI